MYIYTMKEKNGIKRSLDVSKKGFLSIYALTILPLVLTVSSVFIFIMQSQINALQMKQSLHLCEIYAIQVVKNELINYEEENKVISYDQYEVEIEYEDIKAYIKIKEQGIVQIYSLLVWDDIENVVVKYEYLNRFDS